MRSHTVTIQTCILLIYVFSITACGGGDDENVIAGEPTGDTTAPIINDTSPTASATNVARNSVITATFNEDIFATTVDALSFTLANANNNVSGTVGFNSINNIASFVPSNILGPLTSYTATLNSTITDIAGNPLVSNYNWSFTTADGVWEDTATLLETENVWSAYNPQIAFDSQGNALCVWEQSDGTSRHIWSNRYVASTGWSTAELIDINTGLASAPKIAFDTKGNAFSIWAQFDGVHNSIYVNRYIVGVGWSTAELLETYNTETASEPQVAFDLSGNAIAVWLQNDGSRDNVWANRYVFGTGWGVAELIETNIWVNAYSPQVAFDINGNAFAIWQQNEGALDTNRIWTNRYVVGTGWATAELIATTIRERAELPQIAFDGNGNAIAVWQQQSTYYNIWANRYEVGVGWGTATLIENDNIGPATSPQIAFDGNDVAHVIWQQHDGAHDNLLVNRYTTGSGWETAKLIETNSSGNASSPQIAVDVNGNAIAVWEFNDGKNYSVWTNRYIAGSGWSSATLLENYNSGDAYLPAVAVDNSGNALAVWEQTDGSRDDIWAIRFE